MILRLRSGEVTPLRAETNSSAASTPRMLRSRVVRNFSMRPRNWPLRSRPLSTKTQVSRRPMALWMMRAVTSESTPPLSPHTTRSFPTVRRISATLRSMNEDMFQSGVSPASLKRKLAEDFLAVLGVDDLGMELDAVEAAVRVFDGGGLGVGCPARDAEAGRELLEAVAVAHPDRTARLDPAEKAAAVEDAEGGEPVFSLGRGPDLAAEEMGHQLEPVANAQDGDPEVEDPGLGMGSALLVHALGAAGQDDGSGSEFSQALDGGIEREDLGINAQLADFAGDELGGLGPEIKDEDLIHAGILPRGAAKMYHPPAGSPRTSRAVKKSRARFFRPAWYQTRRSGTSGV